MKPYYAGIQQSRETITRYSRVQFNIFKSRTKLAVICFAAGLVVIGLALLNSYKALAVILVFLGCIVFANQDAGANYTANLVIDMFQGKFPRLKYAFFSSGFLIADNEKEIPYRSLIRLVEDDEYLYLFQSDKLGYMIKSSTVIGDRGLQGLKELLAEKTKLKWTRQNRFLTFSLSSQLGLGRSGGGVSLSGGKRMSVSELLFGKRNSRP